MDEERQQKLLDLLWQEAKAFEFTDYRLAKKLGVQPSTISRLRSGDIGVSANLMFRMAEVFPAIRMFLASELLTCTDSDASSEQRVVA